MSNENRWEVIWLAGESKRIVAKPAKAFRGKRLLPEQQLVIESVDITWCWEDVFEWEQEQKIHTCTVAQVKEAAQSAVLFISTVTNARYKLLSIVFSKNSSSVSKLETQNLGLETWFSKASSIEVRVSRRDCQLTFDRYCIFKLTCTCNVLFIILRTTWLTINQININPNNYNNPVRNYYNLLLRSELCLNQ